MNDLSLHILDIVQNSLQAGAKNLEIVIEEDEERDKLEITLKDDGAGMAEEEIARILDPFYTSKDKKTGLGIPLLAQSARETGGDISVESAPGKGTVVKARFRLSHIDRKPIGDLASTIRVIIAGAPSVDLLFKYICGGREYRFDTAGLRDALGEVPIDYPDVLRLISEDVAEGLKELRRGK